MKKSLTFGRGEGGTKASDHSSSSIPSIFFLGSSQSLSDSVALETDKRDCYLSWRVKICDRRCQSITTDTRNALSPFSVRLKVDVDGLEYFMIAWGMQGVEVLNCDTNTLFFFNTELDLSSEMSED